MSSDPFGGVLVSSMAVGERERILIEQEGDHGVVVQLAQGGYLAPREAEMKHRGGDGSVRGDGKRDEDVKWTVLTQMETKRRLFIKKDVEPNKPVNHAAAELDGVYV